MGKRTIQLRIDPDLLDLIDQAAGPGNRTHWIETIARQALLLPPPPPPRSHHKPPHPKANTTQIILPKPPPSTHTNPARQALQLALQQRSQTITPTTNHNTNQTPKKQVTLTTELS